MTLFSYIPTEPCQSMESLCDALFGGPCPTEGLFQYIIWGGDEHPSVAVIGTAEACAQVLDFLTAAGALPTSEHEIIEWPSEPAAERLAVLAASI